MQSFDIFCRVIDNLGDAGICWRLSLHIKAQATWQVATLPESAAFCSPAHPHETLPSGTASSPPPVKVRLFIDDLHRLALLVPDLDPSKANQHIQGIDVVQWHEASRIEQPSEIVIEAFGCDLPEAFSLRMPGSTRLWINLEYLSAEDWVNEWHGLPSIQPNGLRKFFFFPGFTARTGGLLREPDLETRRKNWLHTPENHQRLLRTLNLDPVARCHLDEGALHILLFGYRDAPVQELITGIQKCGRKAVILHPGPLPDTLKYHQGSRHECAVLLRSIPFVAQHDFDTLLWGSHLNFVRGEDSLVRGLWAQRPMVWQIYSQPEQAHHIKLNAFLACSPLPESVKTLMRAWNGLPGQPAVDTALAQALAPDTLGNWQRSMHDWYTRLAGEPDLATRLLEFCAQKSGTG